MGDLQLEEKLKEALKEARALKVFWSLPFKESQEYPLINKDDTCPHCNAKQTYSIFSDERYYTPLDIKLNLEHSSGYSWTENKTCPECKSKISNFNGC